MDARILHDLRVKAMQAEAQQKMMEAERKKALDEIIAHLDNLPAKPKTKEEELDALFAPAIAYVEKHGKCIDCGEPYGCVCGKPLQTYKGDGPFVATELHYRPDLQADEQTIRAREAVIATGVFPGAEEIIRAGMLDHTHGVQSALELQRYQHLPVAVLTSLPHQPQRQLVPKETILPVPVVPRGPNPFLRWVGRTYQKALRMWWRYAKMRAHYDAMIEEIEGHRKKVVRMLEDEQYKSRAAFDRVEELRREINAQKSKQHAIQINDQRHSQMAFHEMLDACKTQEERDALSALVKQAVVHRVHNKTTDELEFSIRIEAPVRYSQKYIACTQCGARVNPITARERYAPHQRVGQVCDTCLEQRKRDWDKDFNERMSAANKKLISKGY